MVDQEKSAIPQINIMLIDYKTDILRINTLLKEDEHEYCSNFGQGNCSLIGVKCLMVFRVMFLIPMLWLAKTILYTKPKDFWLMGSYWGFHIAWMSLASQIIAGFGVSKFWSKCAQYTSTLSLSMSVSICILYWPFEWQNFMHDRRDFTLLTSGFVHSTPIVVNVLNLLLSNTVFLKKDAKYGSIMQFSYMPINLLGGTEIFFGRPVYYQSNLTDWSTPWITFGLYCLSAFVQFLSI